MQKAHIIPRITFGYKPQNELVEIAIVYVDYPIRYQLKKICGQPKLQIVHLQKRLGLSIGKFFKFSIVRGKYKFYLKFGCFMFSSRSRTLDVTVNDEKFKNII